MKMKEILQRFKEYFHVVLLLLGFLIAFPVAYYFLYALPHHNSEKLEFEERKYDEEQQKILDAQYQKENQQQSLEICLSQADMNYYSLWNNECSAWKVEVNDAWRDCRAIVYSWQTD